VLFSSVLFSDSIFEVLFYSCLEATKSFSPILGFFLCVPAWLEFITFFSSTSFSQLFFFKGISSKKIVDLKYM